MPSAENAIIEYEADQVPNGWEKLTDQGDRKDFKSLLMLFSFDSGKEPDVKPNGIATGGIVAPAVSATNDKVDVSALKAYQEGQEVIKPATADLTVTRATPTDTHIINSVILNAAGTVAVVAGTDSTAFSETRGAAGGPPWIPTGAIEIAQVRLSSNVAAPITSDDIKMIVNVHRELYNNPIWDVEAFDVENGVIGKAGVKYRTALPGIHSDDAGVTIESKEIWVNAYEPQFGEVPEADAFVRPAESHTVTSTQVYGGTIGALSKALNQGSFTVYLQDGITDNILSFEGRNLFFKFKADRLKSEYVLCQGVLGLVEAFPAGDNISAAATISSNKPGVRVIG
jgi:hypothetical protein